MKQATNPSWKIALVAGSLLVIAGCASAPPRMDAVPAELTAKAEIPGMPGVRYIPGLDSEKIFELGVEGLRREQAYLASQGDQGAPPSAAYLAISGGGDNGAFAAGLLNGWTATGTRPEFKLVTGISTGALISPFAFLGTKYDATLKEIYTTISPKDVIKPRSLLTGFFSDAMADNTPLYNLTRRTVTADTLREVAAEYARGRFLLIGTADIDARRPVIWDMGKIATYGGPEALDLFVRVMIASASIPAGFPPVMIDVDAGGKRYQEMHVDGGIMAQVFAYPSSLSAKNFQSTTGVTRERQLYVIRNARLDAEWAQTERQTMSIAARAVTSLIQSQGIGDLYRIYATAQRDGVDFNLAFIPPTFNAPHPEEFDNSYMRALYALGEGLAAKGYPWVKTPPGFDMAVNPAPAGTE